MKQEVIFDCSAYFRMFFIPSCMVPRQPPSHAYINAMIIIKEITKSPTIYRPFFRVSWALSTTMSESSSPSGLLCTVTCWILLNEFSSMRVEKFLDISLLQISESFSWNFTGYKKGVLYLVPEVINASGHNFSSTHTQPGSSVHPGLLYISNAVSYVVWSSQFTDTKKGITFPCIQEGAGVINVTDLECCNDCQIEQRGGIHRQTWIFGLTRPRVCSWVGAIEKIWKSLDAKFLDFRYHSTSQYSTCWTIPATNAMSPKPSYQNSNILANKSCSFPLWLET